MSNVMGYASPPSSVDDLEVPDEVAVNSTEHPTLSSGSSDETENVEPTIKRGRGRPRKYPVGTTPSDMLRAKRAVVDPQVVIAVKEYSFRSRRVSNHTCLVLYFQEKRSLSPDARDNENYPVRGLLRAQLEQDQEFAMMPGRILTGISIAPKPVPVPYDGPKRGRGRPKKVIASEETLTLD